jgi:hypothetical protein
VKPTTQLKSDTSILRQAQHNAVLRAGVNVNDDVGLEKEADVMGDKASSMGREDSNVTELTLAGDSYRPTVQRFLTDKKGAVWMGGDPKEFFEENEAQIRGALKRKGFLDLPPNLLSTMNTLMQKNVIEYSIDDLANRLSQEIKPSLIWGRMETSQNQLYAIDPSNRKVLFSMPNAPEPRPKGLYGHKNGIFNKQQIIIWSPNVVFSSKAEDTEVTKLARGTPKRKPNMAKANKLVREIEARATRKLSSKKGAPSMSVTGPNDCRAWAAQLRYLISLELQENQLQEGGESSTFDLAKNPKTPAIKPGDQVTHTLKGSGVQVACGYHAATVVTFDGTSSITLEGHASKDLTAPDFHIREGVTGFVDANNTTPLGESKGFDKEGTIHDVTKSKPTARRELHSINKLLETYDNQDPDILLMIVQKFKTQVLKKK